MYGEYQEYDWTERLYSTGITIIKDKVMTAEELQARYEHCKQNMLCFVSLKPFTGKPSRLFNELAFPQIRFTMGEMVVIEEYVKY